MSALVGTLVALAVVGYVIWLSWLISEFIFDRVSGRVVLVAVLAPVGVVGALVGAAVGGR